VSAERAYELEIREFDEFAEDDEPVFVFDERIQLLHEGGLDAGGLESAVELDLLDDQEVAPVVARLLHQLRLDQFEDPAHQQVVLQLVQLVQEVTRLVRLEHDHPHVLLDELVRRVIRIIQTRIIIRYCYSRVCI